MTRTLIKLVIGLAITSYLLAQKPAAPPISDEMTKLDALATDPDLKLAVVSAMADALHVHRNHILLMRRETGQTLAAIFVAELRARGMDDQTVVRSLRAISRSVDRRGSESVPSLGRPKPVLLVRSAIDHSSVGTIYSVTPEIGIDSSHLAAVIGIPYYRISNSSLSAGSIGDVYGSVFLRGRSAGIDFGSALTIGAPTGDREKGLGAGKVTADIAGTISRRFEYVKPWISGGFANSVFNNVGYQRPYISDGNAAHFSGGLDFPLPRKAAVGVTGFGLEPIGNQTVYSQAVMVSSPQSGGGQNSGGQNAGGTMPGGSMGTGGAMMPLPVSPMPFYMAAQQSVVSASDLRDYGASLWLSIPLRSGLTLNTVVARSVPFHLTTVHVGVGIDVARLLFPGKHF